MRRGRLLYGAMLAAAIWGSGSLLHAQTAEAGMEWVEVFKEDFGGNETSDPADPGKNEPTAMSDKHGVSIHYSGSNKMSGAYFLVKSSTDNSDWHPGSDHTYLGDKTRGYYMRVNPDASKSTETMYVQKLSGICSGAVFHFSAWLANIQISEEGVLPKLAVTINSASDGSGTSYAIEQLVLARGSSTDTDLPWKELSLEFNTGDAAVDEAYFIVAAVQPETNGFDFAVDDISIKVQHPTFNIDKKEADFVYGEPVTLVSDYVDKGFFSNMNNVIYSWSYSENEDGPFTELVSNQSYTAHKDFALTTITSFDKDVHNGYYRLRIGERGSFDSDICSISQVYRINETKKKLNLHLCGDEDVVTEENITIKGAEHSDGERFEANSSITYIISKTVPKTVKKDTVDRCIGTEYMGVTYNTAQDVTFTDTLKSKVYPDCDSLYTVTVLHVHEQETRAGKLIQVCQHSAYNGVTRDEVGEFPDVVEANCTKMTNTIKVNPVYSIDRTYTICSGSMFEGETFATGGSYTRKYNKTSVFGCDSVVNATIEVTGKIVVNLDDEELCEGDSYTFAGKTYTTPGTYQLTTTSTSLISGCDSTTNLKLTIHPNWSNEYSPIDTFICFGSPLFGTIYEQPTTDPILVRNPTTFQTVSGCDSVVYYNLNVIEMELRLKVASDRDVICRGEEVEIDVANLKPADALVSWSHIFNGSKMKAIFTPDRDMTYVVLARNEKAGCEASDTVRIYVRDSPTLTIDTVDQKSNHVEYSVEGGTEPYVMLLDKKELTDQLFGEVNNSFIGMHNLTARDSSGCTSTQQYTITPVPITPSTVFTPNGDGVNDLWTIENIDVYGKARVRIYDRSGKILKEYNGYDNAQGWDGTYQGNRLPATDYWYEINLPEVDTQYIGHFTLFYNIKN